MSLRAAIGVLAFGLAIGCSSGEEESEREGTWSAVALPTCAAAPADGAGNGRCVEKAHACGATAPAGGTPGVVSWQDVTAAVGLPQIKSQSASMRDVDGDGFPDLLVAGDSKSTQNGVPFDRPMLYVGCFGQAFYPVGLEAATTGDPLLSPVSATSISDVDGDGHLDLLLGGHAKLQILYHDGHLNFTAVTTDLHGKGYGDAGALPSTTQTGTLSVFDLDLDGNKDIYVTQLVKDDRLYNVGWDEPTVQDVLLMGTAQRGVWTPPATTSEVWKFCGAGQTFAFNYITRTPFGLPRLLYTGRDFGQDCLLEIDDSGRVIGLLDTPEGPGEGTYATMGVDHTFADDTGDVLIAVADWGKVPVIQVSGKEVTDISDRLDVGSLSRVSWGIGFLDANLDAKTDLVVAYGTGIIAPEGQVEVLDPGLAVPKWLLNSLRYYQGTGSAWVDKSPEAGVLFTPGISGSDDIDAFLSSVTKPSDIETARRDFYEMVTVDFDRDGCPDILTTPMEQFDANFENEELGELKYAAHTTLSLLRNDCTIGQNRWIAFQLPDDPGAFVTLETSAGVRYAQIGASPGVAGIGDPSLIRFGLGPSPPDLRSVTVHWSRGDVSTYPASELTLDTTWALAR